MEEYPFAPRLQSPEATADGGQAKQQSPAPNGTGNRLHALAFWKVGLFEIGFVAVVLLLLFGMLNYFNILSISDVFPNQLGWLPRQQNQTQTQNLPLKNQSVTILPTPTPEFKYDTKKAKNNFIDYLRSTLKPEFLPDEKDIRQGLSGQGTQTNVKRQFGSHYSKNSATISADFLLKQNLDNVEASTIFINVSDIDKTPASPAVATALTSKYFLNPYSIENCSTKGTASYCETFKTEANGKKGFGILFTSNNSAFISVVFTCFMPIDSLYYQTQTTCIPL